MHVVGRFQSIALEERSVFVQIYEISVWWLEMSMKRDSSGKDHKKLLSLKWQHIFDLSIALVVSRLHLIYHRTFYYHNYDKNIDIFLLSLFFVVLCLRCLQQLNFCGLLHDILIYTVLLFTQEKLLSRRLFALRYKGCSRSKL